MELISRETGTAKIVTVDSARIDAALAIEFKDAMRIQTENVSNDIILDLSKVDFIDSSGLGAIVAVMKRVGADRSLILAGLTPMVKKVFQLTKMDSVFTVFDDLNDAVAKYPD